MPSPPSPGCFILLRRLALLVLASALGWSAEPSEVKLALLPSGATAKLGGYMPVRLTLSKSKPKGLKQLPPDLAAPLFGTIKFGPADAPGAFIVVLDEPEDRPSRLFVDANGNGDLTDDPLPTWKPRAVKGKDGTAYQQYSGAAKVTLTLGGEPADLNLPMYRFDKHDPARAALKDALFYYADYGREGTVVLGGKSYRALLADRQATGDFRGKKGSGPSGVQLLIDVNDDGRFERAGETFDVREPFNIGGATYEVAGLTAGGESFRIVASTRQVAEKKVVVPVAGMRPGQPATKFTARTSTGAPVDFPAGYQGRLVLLDFWATWCGPCIAELPRLTAAYQKFHDQGFDVLGVSLDRQGDDRKLADFTKRNKMPWPQIFDGKYWQAEIAQLYGVRSIPAAYLVDGDTGLVVAVAGLRGAELEKTIAAALARKNGK